MEDKERVMNMHPDGKQGVNIEKKKYEVIKDYILSELVDHVDHKFSDLVLRAKKNLNGQFEGKVTWYIVTVKLDLEARGVIERCKKGGVQHLKLINNTGQT